MDLTVTTVYQREDMEGFCAAFLAGKKAYRISHKALRIISTALAIPFWLLAARTGEGGVEQTALPVKLFPARRSN
ncbi:MAG: hypothetical protein Q4B48_08690 [Syntrophomonadaceae bacterium]|nr:hypothetical protein [Syntrophomonadaceae bacterium]